MGGWWFVQATTPSPQPPLLSSGAAGRRPPHHVSSSQGERKGVNKYYPPDFNPAKVGFTARCHRRDWEPTQIPVALGLRRQPRPHPQIPKEATCFLKPSLTLALPDLTGRPLTPRGSGPKSGVGRKPAAPGGTDCLPLAHSMALSTATTIATHSGSGPGSCRKASSSSGKALAPPTGPVL